MGIFAMVYRHGVEAGSVTLGGRRLPGHPQGSCKVSFGPPDLR